MRGEQIPQRPKDSNSLADAVSAYFYNRSATAQPLLSKKRRAKARLFYYQYGGR